MNIKDFCVNIPVIEKKIGYTFRDKSLLTQSFTRTSYCNEHKEKKEGPQSNEVLEFIGDGVLSISIITNLYSDLTKRYKYGIKTELNEGDFSNIKSKLSDKRNLSESTKALGLERYLLMGEGDVKLGIANEPSVMEDLFESIIGAIYIDSGLDISAVMRSVDLMLDVSVYKSEGSTKGSAKGALQEWCADKKRRLPPPEYVTVEESGPDHKKIYLREVIVAGERIARGTGKNLKAADAECALLALEILKSREERPENTPKNSTRVPPKSKTVIKQTAPKAQKDSQKKKEVLAKPAPIPEGVEGSAKKLHEIALSTKSPLPRFRDLGEGSEMGNSLYSVECTYLGISEVGRAKDRKTARELSAFLILEKIKQQKKQRKK